LSKHLPKFFLFFLLLSLIPFELIGMDIGDAKSDSSTVKKSPKGAMIRSLLVPGWGQFYNGKWFKGIIAVGAEAGLVANAYYLDYRLNQSTTDYEREFYRDNRNLSYWWLGAAIILSMLDAYVDAQLYDFDESEDLSLNFKDVDAMIGASGTISFNRAVCLTYRYRF
jgi:TM2 domain-containing membrane protein YozV